jgi:hypothetical protein
MKRTVIECIINDKKLGDFGEDGDNIFIPSSDIKNIIACKAKDGTPAMMVNYYDDEICCNSTTFCDCINIHVIES